MYMTFFKKKNIKYFTAIEITSGSKRNFIVPIWYFSLSACHEMNVNFHWKLQNIPMIHLEMPSHGSSISGNHKSCLIKQSGWSYDGLDRPFPLWNAEISTYANRKNMRTKFCKRCLSLQEQACRTMKCDWCLVVYEH